MKYLILLSLIFALSFIAINQEAFALAGCDDPHCYALMQSIATVEGLEYKLDSPDLHIDISACSNIAVSTGWLVGNQLPQNNNLVEWVESGVTTGHVKNVGCVVELRTYYAINNVVDGANSYQEHLVPDGRVDPGDDVQVKLQTTDQDQVQVYVTTPDKTPVHPDAQVTLDPRNVFRADVGIEGTVSAPDEYSSIPMSKFTDIKIKQNDSWGSGSFSLYTPDTSDGYLGQTCPSNSFIAGSVMSLDCNNIAVSNQVPTPQTIIKNISTDVPLTINLDSVDTDKDYLTYYLLAHPTKGTLDHVNLLSPIINTDGDSSKLVYTPASTPPESENIRYSVTDQRLGHTREGTINIIGASPGPTAPDKVDDFAFILDGNTIKFTWSHPDDGGSDITYYQVDRSTDTNVWQNHNRYSETVTGFDYERHEGYDSYFRIFANNDIGASPVSDLLHVHITDTTPPVVTISSPLNGETFTYQKILVDGFIREQQDTGIEDIEIRVSNVLTTDPISTNVLIIDSYVEFESILADSNIVNGDHTLSVSASNRDGYTGTSNISITYDAPIPKQIDSFSEDFELDMLNWFLSTGDDEFWSVRDSPIEEVPDSSPGNKVGGTEDCDDVCVMEMIDYVDLTQMSSPTLDFYRYVSDGADIDEKEGIIVYTSNDKGDTWTVLDTFTADLFEDDEVWHLETYSLDNTVDEFKVKFEAISSSNSEDTELDDILIYDADATNLPEDQEALEVSLDQTAYLTGDTITATCDTEYSLPEIVEYEWYLKEPFTWDSFYTDDNTLEIDADTLSSGEHEIDCFAYIDDTYDEDTAYYSPLAPFDVVHGPSVTFIKGHDVLLNGSTSPITVPKGTSVTAECAVDEITNNFTVSDYTIVWRFGGQTQHALENQTSITVPYIEKEKYNFTTASCLFVDGITNIMTLNNVIYE